MILGTPRNGRAFLGVRVSQTACLAVAVCSLLLFTFLLSLAAPNEVADVGTWVSRRLHLVHDAPHRPAVDDDALRASMDAHVAALRTQSLTYEDAAPALLGMLLAEPEETASFVRRSADGLREGGFIGTATSSSAAPNSPHDVAALFVLACYRVWLRDAEIMAAARPTVQAAVDALKKRVTADGYYYVAQVPEDVADVADADLTVRTLRHVQAMAAFRAASAMLVDGANYAVQAELMHRRLYDMYAFPVRPTKKRAAAPTRPTGAVPDSDDLGPFHLGVARRRHNPPSENAGTVMPARALTTEQPLILLFLEPGDLPPAVISRLAAAALSLETPVGLHSGRKRKAAPSLLGGGTWQVSPVEQAAVLVGVAKHFVYATSIKNTVEARQARELAPAAQAIEQEQQVPDAAPRPEFGQAPADQGAPTLVDEGEDLRAAVSTERSAAAVPIGVPRQMLEHLAEAVLRIAPVLRQLEDESAVRNEAVVKSIDMRKSTHGVGSKEDRRLAADLQTGALYTFPATLSPVTEDEEQLIIEGVAPLIAPAWGMVPGQPARQLVADKPDGASYEGDSRLVEGRFAVRAFYVHQSGRVSEHAPMTAGRHKAANSTGLRRITDALRRMPGFNKRDAVGATEAEQHITIDLFMHAKGLARIRLPTQTVDGLRLEADPVALLSPAAASMAARGHAPLAYEHIVVHVPLLLAAGALEESAATKKRAPGPLTAVQAAAERARAAAEAVGDVLRRSSKKATKKVLTLRGEGHPLALHTVVAARFFRRLLDDATLHAVKHQGTDASVRSNATRVSSWFGTFSRRKAVVPQLDDIMAVMLSPRSVASGEKTFEHPPFVSEFQWIAPLQRRDAVGQADAVIEAARASARQQDITNLVEVAQQQALVQADNEAFIAGVANRDLRGRAEGAFDAAKLQAAPVPPVAGGAEEDAPAAEDPAVAAPAALPLPPPQEEVEEGEHARRARERQEQQADEEGAREDDAAPARRLLAVAEPMVDPEAVYGRACGASTLTPELRPWQQECCGAEMEQARSLGRQSGGLLSPSMFPMFTCPNSGPRVSCAFVADGYCDCPETASDEPDSPACAKGVFFCRAGVRVVRYGDLQALGAAPRARTPVDAATPAAQLAEAGFIPASKVKDGVQDCADGADEM